MKKKLLFTLLALTFCFVFIGWAKADTVDVANGSTLVSKLQSTDANLTIRLTADISLFEEESEDLIIIINGSDKTLDLNGHTLTVNGYVVPMWETSHTLYITDSG